MKWDNKELLRLAYKYAFATSDDPNTQNGAVLFDGREPLILGSNQFPPGVEKTPERLERPDKYAFMEHAERNAILSAAQYGYATRGLVLVCPWFACPDCARAIVGAGIRRVIGHKQVYDRTPERWLKPVQQGDQILEEGGVEREYYDGPIGECEILFDGEIWRP